MVTPIAAGILPPPGKPTSTAVARHYHYSRRYVGDNTSY